jgi:ATP-dependent protease ClpP protease subunit
VLAVAALRSAVPHARLRLSAPAGAFEGRAADIVAWADDRRRQLEQYCERVAAAIRRPTSWVIDAVHTARWLDAHEAMRIGLLDEIAPPHAASVSPLGTSGLGFHPQRR